MKQNIWGIVVAVERLERKHEEAMREIQYLKRKVKRLEEEKALNEIIRIDR